MQRFLARSRARHAGFALLVAACVAAGAVPRTTQAADGSKQLQRVRGTIGYATVADATDFKAVFGRLDLPDDDYAVTRGQSAAVLAMPDSSLISLGENTSVKVGAFDGAAASPGSTITVNGGALRFDIKRPAGGVANYRFVTATSQVAVRGTVGLLAFANGVTTVGCLACAADSVVVTAGGQTFALATGQFLTVSALGAVTTGTLSTVTAAFSGAGVPTTAQAGAAAAGVPAAAAAGVVPAAAAAAVAGAAAGIAAGSHTPSPTATPAVIPVPTPTPTPVATPTGTVNLTGHAKPAGTPAPAPAAVRAPAAAPAPPGAPGANGRFGR